MTASDGGDGRIFVQIAAYRDPELLPTLRDCLARAARPERLTFGLAWQHDDGESLAEFADDPRLRVLDIDWRDSQGACWARHALQGLHAGEEYTLALDSHHRFEPGWDETLIAQLASCASAKPVLTAYVPAYDPADETARHSTPCHLVADPATIDRVLLTRSHPLDHYHRLTAPLPARFFSAHFAFSRGGFLADCRHDPELYFEGEEISLAVRAYTHGYDLFHPHRTTVYHHYGREGRPKHWSDHPAARGAGTGWAQRDELSRRRVQTLLGMRADAPLDLGAYGLGTARSLADYQAYAGVDFAARSVSDAARLGWPIAVPPR